MLHHLILILHQAGKRKKNFDYSLALRKSYTLPQPPLQLKLIFFKINLYTSKVFGTPNYPKKGLFQVSQQLLAVSPLASLDCNTIANDLASWSATIKKQMEEGKKHLRKTSIFDFHFQK